MGKFKDITGKRFNRLTVLEYEGNSRWVCLCDCGNKVTVQTGALNNGNTKSCGCLQKEYARDKAYNKVPNGLIRKKLTDINGEIPEGCCTTFLDGNTNNLSLTNICTVNKSTYNYLRKHRLLGLGEITRTAIMEHELSQRIKFLDTYNCISSKDDGAYYER